MTTVRLLPTPVPSTASPSNFDVRADAFLGALPDFVTDVNTVAGEININTGIASTSAINAAASELSAANSRDLALAAFGANVWNSLVSYVQGACVYSIVSYKVYRKISTGITLGGSDPSINTTDWKEAVVNLARYLYTNRDAVRSLTPDSNASVIIEGLGLFSWYSASTEIDDDETCFATASGCWLLEATSPDFTISNINNLQSEIDTRFSSWENRIVTVSKYPGIASITASNATSFAVTIVGIKPGNPVIVNPPSTSFYTNTISIWATVTSIDTVTVVVIAGPSGTTITDVPWSITVIKDL